MGEDGIIATSPVALDDFYEMRVADTACRLLDDLARDQPFALYVGFIAPHPPYVLPEPFASLYDLAAMPHDPTQRPEPELLPDHERYCPPEFDEQRQRQAMAAYFGLVSLLNECVGRLLNRLDRRGLAEQTLVVFTADHGEQLGHRGLWNKGYAYDPSIRVPLLMRWPGHLPAGRVSAALLGNVDVAPTILDALDIPPLPHRSGRGFWPVATGERDAHREWIYSSAARGRGVVYRDRQWKYDDRLVGDGHRLTELYDLTSDPAEQINLAAHPAHADRVGQLRDQLWCWQREHLFESSSVLYPDQVQGPTFNAQFKWRGPA